MNAVNRAKGVRVLAPTLVKEIVVKERPNFVKLNVNQHGNISSLNAKRVE